jgi:hypothetical protein
MRAAGAYQDALRALLKNIHRERRCDKHKKPKPPRGSSFIDLVGERPAGSRDHWLQKREPWRPAPSSGKADLTDVVTAVSEAETALQRRGGCARPRHQRLSGHHQNANLIPPPVQGR